MKIQLVSVGKPHDADLKAAIDDFSSRIKKYFPAEWQIIPVPKNAATLIHFLKKNPQSNTSKAGDEETKDSKRAELHYILKGVSDRYFLLQIELLTGRHHQIRVQLGKIGCPIKGDVKYGARRSNLNRAIHLHAWQLTFQHPSTEASISLKALPDLTDTLWQYFTPIT